MEAAGYTLMRQKLRYKAQIYTLDQSRVHEDDVEPQSKLRPAAGVQVSSLTVQTDGLVRCFYM